MFSEQHPLKEIFINPEIKFLKTGDYESFLQVVDSAWNKKGPPSTAPHDFTAIIQSKISLGAFIDNKLVGTSFNLIGLTPNQELCLWVHVLGVKLEHQTQSIGKKLMESNIQLVKNGPLKDIIHSVQLTSDPLLVKNCVLYFHSGMTVAHYEIDAYAAEGRTIPSDRFVFKWSDVQESRPTDLACEQPELFIEKGKNQPVSLDNGHIFIETPLNLSHADNLNPEEGISWREFHRSCFNQLFNNGFIATDITHLRIENKEKAFIICCNK